MNVPANLRARCPYCGAALDMVTTVGGGERQIVPGDMAVCADCAHVLCFDEKMHARKSLSFDYERLTERQRHALWVVSALVETLHARRQAAERARLN
jgi:hypothetical protein